MCSGGARRADGGGDVGGKDRREEAGYNEKPCGGPYLGTDPSLVGGAAERWVLAGPLGAVPGGDHPSKGSQ